jgi:TorA maturation chaperone TorD
MTQPTPNFDWSDVLIGEILLFNMLGKLLYEYPERDWYIALAKDGVFDEIPFGSQQPAIKAGINLLQGWAKECLDNNIDEIFDDVRSDYTRLLIGPGAATASPYESVYLKEGRLIFQESTLHVRSWYVQFGLETENLYSVPDDHIGLELVFMAHLAHLASTALDNKNTNEFQNALDAQRNFGKEHLFRWAPIFCALVHENAQTDFYRGIALTLQGALTELQKILEIEL